MLHQLKGTNTRIIGTLHRVPTGMISWLSRVLEQCKWAEEFAVEMLLANAPAIFSTPTNRTVSLLPSDLRAKLKDRWPAHLGPLEEANLPGATLMAAMADMPTDPGVEYVVESEAADGRPIHELEDASGFHAGFADIPASQFATAIRMSLKRTPEHRAKRLIEFYERWEVGDRDELYATLVEELPPAFKVPMFVARNAAWSPRIASLARRQAKLLVCVGAGHLCGPNNVLEFLERDHGIAAEEIRL